jgi:hypothetical protein
LPEKLTTQASKRNTDKDRHKTSNKTDKAYLRYSEDNLGKELKWYFFATNPKHSLLCGITFTRLPRKTVFGNVPGAVSKIVSALQNF